MAGLQSNEEYHSDYDGFTEPQSFISKGLCYNLKLFVRGIKRMIQALTIYEAFLPTITLFFWAGLSVFCLPAETKCHFRNVATVQPVYAQAKCGKWVKNEEHLRCIKFATGWTVTLLYWAAVKQGLTTSTPSLALATPPSWPKKRKNIFTPLP